MTSRLQNLAHNLLKPDLPTGTRAVALRFLTSQFYVPFAVLWPAASASLKKLATAKPEEVWPVLQGAMEAVSGVLQAAELAAPAENKVSKGEEEEGPEEDSAEARLLSALNVKERTTEALNHHNQLFKLLYGIPALVEQKSKHWIGLLEDFLQGPHHEYFLGSTAALEALALAPAPALALTQSGDIPISTQNHCQHDARSPLQPQPRYRSTTSSVSNAAVHKYFRRTA